MKLEMQQFRPPMLGFNLNPTMKTKPPIPMPQTKTQVATKPEATKTAAKKTPKLKTKTAAKPRKTTAKKATKKTAKKATAAKKTAKTTRRKQSKTTRGNWLP